MPRRNTKPAVTDVGPDSVGAEEALVPTPGNDTPGLLVSRNLSALRRSSGFTLDALALRSGVSRGMLRQIELGRSVPTINVLWKIANAFGVPFSTLLAADDEPTVRVLRAAEAKILVSQSGRFSSRALYPFGRGAPAEFYELRLAARTEQPSEAHRLGTLENLVLVHGALTITVVGAEYPLAPGDSIYFHGDQPHSYVNTGHTEALAYLVMSYPSGGG